MSEGNALVELTTDIKIDASDFIDNLDLAITSLQTYKTAIEEAEQAQEGFTPLTTAPIAMSELEKKIDVLMGIYKPKAELTPGVTPKAVETIYTRLGQYLERYEPTKFKEEMITYTQLAHQILKSIPEMDVGEQKGLWKAFHKLLTTEWTEPRTLIKEMRKLMGNIEFLIRKALLESREFTKKYGVSGVAETAVGTGTRADIINLMTTMMKGEPTEFAGMEIDPFRHIQLGLKEYGGIKADIGKIVEQQTTALKFIRGELTGEVAETYMKSLKRSMRGAVEAGDKPEMVKFYEQLLHVLTTFRTDPEKAEDIIKSFLYKNIHVLSGLYEEKQLKKRVFPFFPKEIEETLTGEQVPIKKVTKAMLDKMEIQAQENKEMYDMGIEELKAILEEQKDEVVSSIDEVRERKRFPVT